MRLSLSLALVPALLAGQSGGITPDWEIRKSLQALIEQARRLTPMLDEIRVNDWVAAGAPETYLTQANQVRAELGYLIQTTNDLIRTPEKMTTSLETYLRLESIETVLYSLSQGIRRYQNPALADLIQGMVAENHPHRARLRDYLVELIGNKEAELRIMNEEAQRCRGFLINRPPSRPAAPKPPAPKPANPPAERKQNP